jgi:peptidoglycan/xylan/chitin deacetylase (PgdA/CDA1 family)
MRLRGLSTLQRAASWVRRRFVSGALVLLYHRVGELPSDPQLLCVTPEHFAEQLEILRQYTQPISLQHLVRAYHDGHLPERAVAVTFDDGYLDNLVNAKPLLERYDIPATVFVTTGKLSHRREFWWDELDRILLQPGPLPPTLYLRTNGRDHQWELGEAAHYSVDAYRHHRSWNVLGKDTPSPRHLLYLSLHRLIRPLPHEEQQRVMDALLAWAGVNPAARPTHRTLSADELLSLVEGGHIEAGAHSMTHPVLSTCTAAVQRAEIQGSKAQLEEMLGRPVSSFAYPYGFRSDYTGQTVSLARQSGFTCACSGFPDVVWRGTDRFQLPRHIVFDWLGEEFAKRLERWFHG